MPPTWRACARVVSASRRSAASSSKLRQPTGEARRSCDAGARGASEDVMPRGEKSKYTGKQDRKADHIAEGYEKRGVGKKEAERRAWASVNKDDGGGKKAGGSGRGKRTGRPAAHKGGRK